MFTCTPSKTIHQGEKRPVDMLYLALKLHSSAHQPNKSINQVHHTMNRHVSQHHT